MVNESYDDEILWKMYSPKPNPWFSSEVSYEGWGVATFEKPAGTIEGKAKITVDETGKLDVEMEIEKLNTEATIYGTGSIRFLKFLQANMRKSNAVAMGTGNINPCSSLSVQTERGIFTSHGKVFHTQAGLDDNVRFLVSEGIYQEQTDSNPKYWVVPLTNFISTFHLQNHPLVAQHPLRLYTSQIVPKMADKEQEKKAWYMANQANTSIGFYFGESVGYIQPVLDYTAKKEKLTSGEIKKCITALMVSDVTEKLDETWFPYDYTSLISFASGLHVGAAWIEYRDENGQLVNRKHIGQFDSPYQKEYAVIDEAIHGGLGHLLSMASNSPEFGKPYVRSLIAHLVRLQSYSRQIEDHFDLLCRSFDSLCEEHGLGVQNLAKNLPSELQTKINSILGEATREVQKLQDSENSNVGPVLERIKSKIANAKNTERAFGLAVVDLLQKYGLPDAMIMEKYYAEHPEIHGKSWAQTLSKYRGAAIHTGYFSHEAYNVQDVVALEDHLQDILIRIALKILNYEGTYQPRVILHWVDGNTINWVGEDTPVIQLGYKAPIV